ncbi:MAG: amidase family protein, partial [Aquincola tertiaricarbonis]
MNEHPLLTLIDWRRAYAAGATPSVLLATLAQRLQASPAAAWITRASAAQLQAQADALEARRAAAGGDLQAMPLYGVPFAVKDNIDIEDVDTTAACPAFAYRAGSSAQAVQRLLA